jgi:hypothetical protein
MFTTCPFLILASIGSLVASGLCSLITLPQLLAKRFGFSNLAGRSAFLAWGPFERPLFESTIGTVLRLLPNATVPDQARKMFQFAAPGSLQAALHDAGFRSAKSGTLRSRGSGPVRSCSCGSTNKRSAHCSTRCFRQSAQPCVPTSMRRLHRACPFSARWHDHNTRPCGAGDWSHLSRILRWPLLAVSAASNRPETPGPSAHHFLAYTAQERE